MVNSTGASASGFNKYDGVGRVILTGIISSSASQSSWQASIDAQVAPNLWEERNNTNLSGTTTGYNNRSLPTSGVDVYHAMNYFDDYGFDGNSSSQRSG